MICNNCNKEKHIVNKHYNLCLSCNKERLNSTKPQGGESMPYISVSRLKTAKNKNKGSVSFVKNFVPKKNKSDKIREDEDFYKECFDNSEHLCEECNTQLPTTFRDENGKIIARWRYSHIIPKSIAPELRHSLKNINHLCLKHHMEWENGVKERMKIFLKNKLRLPNYF